MNISFKTLGCRLNQHETDALVSAFYRAGYQIVDFKEQADITIINTCTVTSQSDHKSRNIIQQAIQNNPNGQVIVTGCMAEQYKTDLEQIPGVAMVISNNDKSNILNIVEQKLGFATSTKISSGVFNYQPVQKSLHTRAAIKIQDGCDNYCTFCIIPQVRGRAISRPVNEVIQAVKDTIANGFKEIVLTGVNIGRYYHEGTRFTGLLKQILDISGDFRIRISSLEPDGFGTEFVELFRHPKLMPHLHLCLQSGSDQILLKMRRMYTISSYMQLIGIIKATYTDFNLTTDIIVGFPGETDRHFKESLNIVKQIGFSHVHTFKYSVRQGTYAERMPNQVNEKIKSKRSEMLRLLSEKNKKDYYQQFIGKTDRVLVEKDLGNNWYMGYGEHYIPVMFRYPQYLKNQWMEVKITKLTGGERLMVQGIAVTNGIVTTNKHNKTYGLPSYQIAD
ncbi:MAG: tRNA (N(6)-L-threonylcarbamoyladenosine(37)-C(2))-methylthiotransferase MtaB [Bacteroidetes bacterium HGW-Bacteroidetes-4]|jgi:threonylcarbamoyladenosine tRNA methylthiotransferase MtaB|nr:MAG: tRNA (N(6)-L-threonylcarbamoyladenosine(37)-C(2))-methylthiotransferase MtaB [Bacteroidetes bacterium HGW-Bacteroidetes-4]